MHYFKNGKLAQPRAWEYRCPICERSNCQHNIDNDILPQLDLICSVCKYSIKLFNHNGKWLASEAHYPYLNKRKEWKCKGKLNPLELLIIVSYLLPHADTRHW
jgi:hypothetical protein